MIRLNEAVKAERGALSLTIAGDIGRSFHMQASLNTKVVKPVMHIALSFMKEDEPALTDRRMSEIAEDYLRRMKLDNTQYVVIRHHKPGGNPHVHIILNLVGNDGNRLDTDFIRRRNINVCKNLNKSYGLHWSRGKDNTDVEKLRSKEKTSIEESENINQSGASRPESYVLGVLADLMESQTPEVQKDNNDKQKRKKRRI